MHPFNRSYDPNNPFGYQENPNPSTPPNPTQIPITHSHPQQPPHSLVYSPCPDLAGIASYLGNRVYTNFPYDDSSIPVNLSQPDYMPETQTQDVGGSSSKPAKKRSHEKKTNEEKATAAAQRTQLKWTIQEETTLTRCWIDESQNPIMVFFLYNMFNLYNIIVLSFIIFFNNI
ncbi:hypothetical protein HanIR_Chr17g0877251 [Helianthus annuus]|nr:hypothetical protein HanIR_Chr17g0877251 [Helianthus annuus]